jgi:amidase
VGTTGRGAAANVADMADLHDLTALDQARLVRQGDTTSTELTRHYLDRVDARSEELGAFVTLTADAALASAAAADERVAQARRDGTVEALGPLYGVPSAVKDLSQTAGVRTTFGSAVFSDFVPSTDDFSVRRMRAAGLVSLGKTNVPEFGLPCYTEPEIGPPARTPWDTSRSAGGSSGGAAAAVAAGLLPLAHGSDGGGSLRIPASVCGLVGFKPTRGRVSGGPLALDVAGLSQQGPLSRTVADAAALLDVLAGYEPGDPYWAPPLPDGQTYLAASAQEPGRMRIARFIDPFLPAEISAESRTAYERTSDLLVSLGHEVTDVPTPEASRVLEKFLDVWAVGGTLAPVPPAAEDLLTPLTRMWRARAAKVSGTGYAQALSTTWMLCRQVVADLWPYDAVLTPTLALPPVPIGWFTDPGDPEEDLRRQLAFTPYTALWNATGMPAVSLPLNWTDDGLPIGVMFGGRPDGEVALLRLAKQLEAEMPWADRRPPGW